MSKSNNGPKFFWDKKSWAYLGRRRLWLQRPGHFAFEETPFFIKACKKAYERHHPEHKYTLFGAGMDPSGCAKHLHSAPKVVDLMEFAQNLAIKE